MINQSILMIAGRAFILLLGLMLGITLARLLGPDARGSLAIIILSINFASIGFEMGLPQASIYILGKDMNTRLSSIINYFNFSSIVSISSIPIVGTIIYFSSSFESNLIIFITLSVASSISMSFARHILLGLGQFFAYTFNVIIEVSLYFSLILFLYLFNLDNFSRDNIVGAYFISVAVSQIVAWLSVWQKIKKLGIKESNFKKFDTTIVVDTFHKGKHLFVAGISGFLQQRIVFLILSQTLGAKSVGLYTVAGTLPNLLVHFPQQIATVVYSGTSKISGEEDKQKKINSIVLFIQLTLLLALAIFLLSFPFSGQIVALIFGSDYEGLGTVFSSLIFSAGLMGVTTIIFNALAGLGMHIYSSYIGVFSTILLTVLCLSLTPIIGLEGAAYSQVLISLISSTIGLGLLKKFYNFEIKRFFYSPFKLWKLVS